MHRFTVVWSPSALRRLADLWLNNPKIRSEITEAANQIDATLAEAPDGVGIDVSERARLVVRPPLTVLYLVFVEDRQVRVIFVKHWYD